MTIKKDLQTLNKGIKVIEKKLEKLIKEIDKNQKPKVAKKAAAKPAMAKTTKKAPAKRVPAKKKPAEITATDQVLKIINGSKNGVDAPTLMRKTGFNEKKVRNILQRTYKLGKIKRAEKGIYVGI